VFLLAAFTAGLAHLLLAMLPGFCGASDWDFVGFVSPTVPGVIRGTVLYLLWSLMFVVGSLSLERVEARQRTAALQQEVRDAELRLLLDQLDPHFLFNVLMLVQAEADDPDRVRELVLRMLLPRLTVQTLVEHAVHHGFQASGEATEIVVTARLERELLLEVAYPRRQETLVADGSPSPEDDRSQGLQDLCRRLELLVGPEARLHLMAGDGLVTARIQSPVQHHS
jgi:LytS/YehU family sensor histidine kinase